MAKANKTKTDLYSEAIAIGKEGLELSSRAKAIIQAVLRRKSCKAKSAKGIVGILWAEQHGKSVEGFATLDNMKKATRAKKVDAKYVSDYENMKSFVNVFCYHFAINKSGKIVDAGKKKGSGAGKKGIANYSDAQLLKELIKRAGRSKAKLDAIAVLAKKMKVTIE